MTDREEGQEAECQHDPALYHLMVGETAENPSKGEPKSVICGGCGKTWSVAAAHNARRLEEQVEAVRALAYSMDNGSDAVQSALARRIYDALLSSPAVNNESKEGKENA